MLLKTNIKQTMASEENLKNLITSKISIKDNKMIYSILFFGLLSKSTCKNKEYYIN